MSAVHSLKLERAAGVCITVDGDALALDASAISAGHWIEQTGDDLLVHLGRTKTDQAAEGDKIGVPYGSNPATCPVRAWRAWKAAAVITTGPAFRSIDRHGNRSADRLSDRAVALIIKRVIEAGAIANGMTVEAARQKADAFAGHFLRSGLATSTAANDAPGHLVQRHLRHKRFDTTARYIRDGEMFKRNAGGMVGL